MASSEHPLNRARHRQSRVALALGQGIVSSTDNFGFLGSKPSHPELLDWLARTFIESGWSIKDLHRLIMKSAAYRQASNVSFPPSDKVDPRIVDPKTICSGGRISSVWKARKFATPCSSPAAGSTCRSAAKPSRCTTREFVFNHTSKDADHLREPAPRALSPDHPQSSPRYAGAVRLPGPHDAHREPQQHGHRPAGRSS